MGNSVKKRPKVNVKQKKKSEKIKYKIFIGFAIANVIYYCFFEPLLFGQDIRYNISIFWIPIILGCITVSALNVFELSWKELFSDLKKEKNIFLKVYYPIFFLLMNLVFSYLTFGFTARVVWNTINLSESKKNNVEVFYLPVYDFSESRGKGSDRIYFRFKNNLESIPLKHQTIKPYLEANPDDYTIILKVRKGVWNHYVFEDWDLIKK